MPTPHDRYEQCSRDETKWAHHARCMAEFGPPLRVPRGHSMSCAGCGATLPSSSPLWHRVHDGILVGACCNPYHNVGLAVQLNLQIQDRERARKLALREAARRRGGRP